MELAKITCNSYKYSSLISIAEAFTDQFDNLSIRIRSLLCSHIHYLKIQQQPTESLVWSYEAKVNQMTALMPKGISVSPGPRQLQLFVPQSLFIKFIFLLLKCSCNTWSRCQIYFHQRCCEMLLMIG